MESQRQDVRQLKKRMALLAHENGLLEKNIHDAESALRTSAR